MVYPIFRHPFEFTITILWDICQALWQKEFDAEPYVVPSTYQYCINTWSAVQCLVHLSICLSRINEFTWGFLSHNEVMIWWWSELGYSVKWSTVKTLAVVVVIDSLEAYANRGQTVVKKVAKAPLKRSSRQGTFGYKMLQGSSGRRNLLTEFINNLQYVSLEEPPRTSKKPWPKTSLRCQSLDDNPAANFWDDITCISVD